MALAWASMVGTTKTQNSSNFDKIKFVKVFNKPRMIHIVLSTSQTPILWLINWPTPKFSLLELNVSNVLTLTITIANTI
jgi:hypothetical protein